jgi:predicted adenine nucleotide alpha hydrolase (AANH) superfamily ATPase
MINRKILLLSCCAPCSTAVIEKLKNDGVDFEVVFFNPNIHPLEEYTKRLNEQRMYCEKLGVNCVELEYEPKEWFEAVKGFEEENERGKRCDICFYFRLKRVMKYAKDNGVDYVASVLGVSRWKDINQVNRAGYKASDEVGVPYIEVEGRKNGMQQRRIELIKEYKMYSQDYCGCVFSMRKGEK